MDLGIQLSRDERRAQYARLGPIARESVRRNAEETLLILQELDNERTEESFRCPACQEDVSEDLYYQFVPRDQRAQARAAGAPPVIPLRMIDKLCQRHTASTTRAAEWRKHGYPEIDWDTLPSRVEAHLETLLPRVPGILDGTIESPFKVRYQQEVTGGPERGLPAVRNSPEVAVGYYGPRGQDVMLDKAMFDLSRVVRQRATEGFVQGGGKGAARFITWVLLPELALSLIQEDLDCSVDRALVVLEESSELGRRFHADTSMGATQGQDRKRTAPDQPTKQPGRKVRPRLGTGI